jgi:hypothetical protein
VDLIDRSFGFTTSVEAAQAAIVSAKTEARCNLPNGIGEKCECAGGEWTGLDRTGQDRIERLEETAMQHTV